MFIKTLLALTLVITVSANHLPADDDKSAIPADQWFNQYVDHFTITDNRQWKQRYQMINDYYKDGGPVFINLGQPSPISGEGLPHYTITEYAKKFGAKVFQLEHRFFGESHPTEDTSTANLIYLTSDQVLADTAYFIEAMTAEQKLPEGTKWIVFGAAFAGQYAAWMRQKYPHLVYGAVADSGPLLAKVNLFEYKNAVRDIIAGINPECVKVIEEGNKKVFELAKTPEGAKILDEKFKTCDPIDINNKNDVIGFYGILADIFSEVAQYNGLDAVTLEDECNILLDTSVNDVLDRYAMVNQKVMEAYDFKCNEYKYDGIIKSMQSVSWDSELVKGGSRQFYYQFCAEFGLFRTSCHPEDFFMEKIPLEWLLQQCSDIFGKEFNKELAEKAVYRTNLMFGGLDTQATRVAYIYSSGDPWHVLGLTETKVAESPVFYIQGGRREVLSEVPTDTAESAVTDAWNQVQDLVGKWCSA